MVESQGRILLVGASQVGKHDLLSAIREAESERASDGAYPWRLDNKYYTADVQIDVRHVDQCHGLQLGDCAYEAVVLVFDAGQSDSFDAVQRWYEAAGGSDADLGVKLAVGTRADSRARLGWLGQVEEWCAEQLIEYVEMAAAGAEEAAAGAAGGEGATGVPRIREALAVHMWPGMQMKPQPRHGAAAAAVAPASAAAALQAVQQQAEADVEEAVQAAAAAAGARSLQPSANGVQPSTNGGSAAADGSQLSFAELLRLPLEQAAAAGGSSGAGEAGDEEGEVEQLDQLFTQVASHRTRLAQLPDAQRREAAAALVMQLMAAMGLEEEGDEEEDE